MPRSYGRGFAGKAAFTKKCHCQDPAWRGDHIEVTRMTYEIAYVLECRNCGAYWVSKSHRARQHWEAIMDTVPITWEGFGYDGKKTVRELFQEVDKNRLDYLARCVEARKKEVIEAQNAAESARKEVIKYLAAIGEETQGASEKWREVGKICKDDAKRELFFDHLSDEMYEQITSDDETPEHKYFGITRKYLEADAATREEIDDFFMDLTGWRFSTLLENALERYND